MNIEKNQIFKLSETPLVVGVVTGTQCSAKDSWYVKTTLGDVAVWNNMNETWRGSPDFAKLTPSSLLTNAPQCCGGCDCEEDKKELLGIELGEIWTTEEGDRVVIVLSEELVDLDGEDLEDEELYPFVAVFLDKPFEFNYVNGYGESIDGDFVLTEFESSI